MTSTSRASARRFAKVLVVALAAVMLLITAARPEPADAESPATTGPAPAAARPAPDRTIRPSPDDDSGRGPAFASSGSIFADPGVVRIDSDVTNSSTYRMYSTNFCEWIVCMTVPTISTSDFGTYTSVTDAMPNGVGSWASPGFTWAPEVHRFGSEWVLFYTARVSGTASTQCIGRAVASSPAGPFVDNRGTPFVCTNAPSGSGAGGAIDASVYVSGDGTPYLLWKNDGNNPNTCRCTSTIWSNQLSVNGTSLVGSPRSLISNGGDYTVEAPQLIPAESGLWLLYSAGYYGGPDYRTDVGWCAGPLGPCTRSGPNLMRSEGGLVAPGGAGTVTDRVGRTWMAYHSGTIVPDDRRLQIDALSVDPGGPRRILEPISVHDPWGGIDAAYAVPGGLAVTGWAIDPNGDQTTEVEVSVLNSAGAPLPKAVVSANLSHGAIAQVLGPSANHGFSATVTTLAMPRTVCLRAVNTGLGVSNPQFACRTVEVRSGAPFGSLDAVVRGPGPGSGTVTVSGWAIDPDTTAPIDIHIWSGGQLLGTTSATNPRGDIGAAFPGYGPNHGFTTTVNAPPGSQEICVYAINTGPGNANPRFPCQTTVAPSGNPYGSLDAVQAGPGSVTVSGWAIDPDTAAPIDIHIWSGGQLLGTTSATNPRGDIGAAYPGYGPDHGFSTTVNAPPGSQEICVYAINTGPGNANPRFPCRTVTVASGNPFGTLDSVTAHPGSGTITVSGWAIDPDTTAPIDIHIWSGGQLLGTTSATNPRGDIGAAFPGYGPDHGFSTTVNAPPGSHEICVYAINTGPGNANPRFPCRTVFVS